MITREQLSEEQETALQYMLDFIDGNGRQMLLSGYAGTGKTSLLKIFIKELAKRHKYKEIYCTAPTNEAVRVIANATNKPFDKTIYSILGLLLIEEEGKKPIIRQQNKSKLEEYDVIIIDEASMIGDELLALIEQEVRKYSYIKVIYVGDSAQLPPVNTDRQEYNEYGEPIGLIDEQIESKVFLLQKKIQLTQVQRVAQGNPIINVVTPIRNNLESKEDCFERMTLLNDGIGVEFFDNRDHFLELMYNDFKSENYKENNNFVRAVAFTNKAVNALNQHIRKRLFDCNKPDEFMVNENLIAASPVLVKINSKVNDIKFTIGERLRVLSAIKTTDPEFGFDIWKLNVINYESKKPETHNIKVIAKESIELYYKTLDEFANEAKQKMYAKTVRNGKEVNLYNKFEAWQDYYKFKEQFAWVKYSYAMTIHKSQGSTVENVYVIERDMNILAWNDIIRNKLKYTAFTRASKLLRILQ